MEIIALVLSALAVVAAGLAVWYSRGQKLAADRSAEEAKRSADASERSADAAQEATGYQRAEVERNRIRFVLEPPITGQAYLLRNAGTDTAYGVHVDVGDLGVADQHTDFETYAAGYAEKFLLSRRLGSKTTHIEVTWYAEPKLAGEPQRTRLLV